MWEVLKSPETMHKTHFSKWFIERVAFFILDLQTLGDGCSPKKTIDFKKSNVLRLWQKRSLIFFLKVAETKEEEGFEAP